MFISLNEFALLIKQKGPNVEFLITELVQNILYGWMDVSLGAYKHFTRHPKSKHSGGSWEHDAVWVADFHW